MENPFKRSRSLETEQPILTPVEIAARAIWAANSRSIQIADLSRSTPGINLNLSDVDRKALLAELDPAIRKLGFTLG